MSESNHRRIQLSDGTVMYGFRDEYISDILESTKNYYEIEELQRFSKYIPPNPVIYDIGANIGNHTVYFRKYYHARKIYAFEPIPFNAELLEKNVSENALDNIKIFRVAVGKTRGNAELIIDEKNMGSCRIVVNPDGSVPVMSLNEMELDLPNFVKIDVEGNELNVLSGMTVILSSCNPVIWIKIHDRFKEADQLLSQYQYELVDTYHFNYIYLKYSKLDEKLIHLNSLKQNLVLETNRVSLENEELKREINNLKNDYERKIAEMQQTIEEKNREILNRLDSEEKTLLQYKNAILEYHQLEARYAQVSKKYAMLRNSKLGRLTVKYWQFRKRIPKDF